MIAVFRYSIRLAQELRNAIGPDPMNPVNPALANEYRQQLTALRQIRSSEVIFTIRLKTFDRGGPRLGAAVRINEKTNRDGGRTVIEIDETNESQSLAVGVKIMSQAFNGSWSFTSTNSDFSKATGILVDVQDCDEISKAHASFSPAVLSNSSSGDVYDGQVQNSQSQADCDSYKNQSDRRLSTPIQDDNPLLGMDPFKSSDSKDDSKDLKAGGQYSWQDVFDNDQIKNLEYYFQGTQLVKPASNEKK